MKEICNKSALNKESIWMVENLHARAQARKHNLCWSWKNSDKPCHGNDYAKQEPRFQPIIMQRKTRVVNDALKSSYH